jgi:hypothetical protein
MKQITAQGIRLDFDPRGGLIERFTVTDAGREIAPLHRAPWVGTGEAMPAHADPLMSRLGGDFFCAHFAAREGSSPLHGWSPNSDWSVIVDEPGRLRAMLLRQVFGASLIKELSLRDGHPLVYQRHVFIGGSGRVAVANHANVSVPNGALIRTSAKRHWETPKTAQESDPARGRSGLRYPARSSDPTAFPGVDGPIDLTRYPWNPRHEDFVAGLESSDHALGWTAVTRPQEGDLYLSLRNARALPMTMLWHSNGGRDYAPWSGRHFGCLGVEEGAADHMLGQSTEADLSGPGALTLTPDGTAEVRHVIGAIDWPSAEPVVSVSVETEGLVVAGEGGERRVLPFDAGFLRLEG